MMKKVIVLSIVLLGATVASQAGVSFRFEVGSPGTYCDPVISQPPPVAACAPAPVYTPPPVCSQPAPVVAAPPVCEPAPVVVTPSPAPVYYPEYRAYPRPWHGPRWHGYYGRGHWDRHCR